MTIIKYSAIDLVKALQKSGVAEEDLLDFTYRTFDVFEDIDTNSLYSVAKTIQHLHPKQSNSALIIGEHSIYLYYIMGKLVNKVYVIENQAFDEINKIKQLKKLGFGNIEIANSIKSKAPYENIIIDYALDIKELNPYLSCLEKSGCLVVKCLTEEKEFLKITKIHEGFIEERYDPLMLEYEPQDEQPL